jgi:DNA topoisomerase I
MKYQEIERNRRHLDAIAKAMRGPDALYLATDPDREGEAISWHVCEALRERGLLDGRPSTASCFTKSPSARSRKRWNTRARFPATWSTPSRRGARWITWSASISPRCCGRRSGPGLSAGRVQTPALRLIVEREARSRHSSRSNTGRWKPSCRKNGRLSRAPRRVRRPAHRRQAREVLHRRRGCGARSGATLREAAAGKLKVAAVERRQRRQNPAPPFTTSTLQQEAARKLGFTAQKTMRTAQRLYEGVDFGEGATGPDHLHAHRLGLAGGDALTVRSAHVIGQRFGARRCRRSRAITAPRPRMPRKPTRPSGRPRLRGIPTTSPDASIGTSSGSTS